MTEIKQPKIILPKRIEDADKNVNLPIKVDLENLDIGLKFLKLTSNALSKNDDDHTIRKTVYNEILKEIEILKDKMNKILSTKYYANIEMCPSVDPHSITTTDKENMKIEYENEFMDKEKLVESLKLLNNEIKVPHMKQTSSASSENTNLNRIFVDIESVSIILILLLTKIKFNSDISSLFEEIDIDDLYPKYHDNHRNTNNLRTYLDHILEIIPKILKIFSETK